LRRCSVGNVDEARMDWQRPKLGIARCPIRSAVGRFTIAEKLKDSLTSHIELNCSSSDSWIFTGNKGRHLSQRSIQEIIRSAAKKAGIYKNVHLHTLRHSFATHLIEDGYDLASLQFLLGHTNVQTTMVYVHMASPKMISVKSPYDSLR